jgi:hypothetical protein
MSSPHLLPEILDYTVDLLHDQPESLERCCLVSKSWVPRTRKHLFVQIIFQTEEHLRLWKEMFPDPSISPAHYTKILSVFCLQAVVAADAEAGGWIRGFSRVVHLGFFINRSFSLVPFHRISPDIKTLIFLVEVPALPSSRIINLILSFPLLEDLGVHVITPYGMSSDNDDSPDRLLTAVQPSSLPVCSGFLELFMQGGMEPVTRPLLSLPLGIHFRKLVLAWYHEADLLTTIALVEGCSHTLESLKIYDFSRTSVQHARPY